MSAVRHKALNSVSQATMLALLESPCLTDLKLNLRAASMETLVEQCVLAFPDDNETPDEPLSALPSALFLVHKWYIPSSQLCSLFLHLCQNGRQLLNGVCRTIKYWMSLFPEHFDNDSELCKCVDDIRKEACRNGCAQLGETLDTKNIPSYSWMRNISVRNLASRQVSLSFEQWMPEDIAVNLTHIEYKLLRRITFAEYKEYANSCQLRCVPTLQRSIAVFNSLSQWVQCMVLNKCTAKERAEVVTKFVLVAKSMLNNEDWGVSKANIRYHEEDIVVRFHIQLVGDLSRLRKLQNFNTLMAVVGGLSHSSLARLTKTFVCLSSQIRQDFNELTALLAASGNFNEYRKALSQGKGFKIPIVGVHLKDLISLHSASNDSTNEGLINCRKLAQLASIFTHLLMDIQRPHSFPDPNTDLIHTLKVSLDMPYSDDEIYALSLKREPRTLLQPSLSRPVVIADWAVGVGNDIDPQLVKKHVSAMVETVFKHYDDDKDGYISQGEFDSIAGNFPFIDSFNVIDSDNDGRISRTDLLQYFIRLNRTIKVDCRHCFKETTFLAPSFCYHCKKMLWGILRQGMKCQNCGLPVHRSCKDHVITDCSTKRRQLLNGSLTAGKSPLAAFPMSARYDADPSPSGDSCSSSRSQQQQQNEALLSPQTQRSRKLWPGSLRRSFLHFASMSRHPADRSPMLNNAPLSSTMSARSSTSAAMRVQRMVSSSDPPTATSHSVLHSPPPPRSSASSVASGNRGSSSNRARNWNSFRRKNRCWSENVEGYRSSSPCSEHVASLASEEVFEIEEVSETRADSAAGL